jgi:hypothetical protein
MVAQQSIDPARRAPPIPFWCYRVVAGAAELGGWLSPTAGLQHPGGGSALTILVVLMRARSVAAHSPDHLESIMAKEPKKLEDLFHDTLKDIYFAEKKILATLPKMTKSCAVA